MSYKRRVSTLIKSEKRLQKIFLNFRPRPTTNYTQRQLRQAESYVIHVHSELECYFEDMAAYVVAEAERKWDGQRKASAPLLFLASFYNEKVETVKKIPNSDMWHERIKAAINAHRAVLGRNHGIRPKNVVSLFAPIGFDVRNIDGVLLSELNSFGTMRGGYAHSSLSLRAGTTFDPFIFVQQSSRLVSLIQNFDQDVQNFIHNI